MRRVIFLFAVFLCTVAAGTAHAQRTLPGMRSLVLHGGTGIPDEQLLLAFQRGINKLNVGTEFFWLYYQTIKSYDAPDITQLPRTVQAALTEYLKKKFQLSF